MIAIGFDPGTARLGYGVIESDPDPRAIDFGVIVTDPNEPMAQRLLLIHSAVGELIDRHRPDAVAVESLFFAQNVTTAMTVGQARGTVLLAAAQRDVAVTEYALYSGSTLVVTTTDPFATLSALTAGTTYTFTAIAYDAAGNSASSKSFVINK